MYNLEIEYGETTKHGKPKPTKGLSDPRLGTIDRKMKCKTCMGKNKQNENVYIIRDSYQNCLGFILESACLVYWFMICALHQPLMSSYICISCSYFVTLWDGQCCFLLEMGL
ncbi:DNA-directed RNA polymerase subunit [Quillaja saponaria]|uniref:DNA-directed RNA polymerase n=1 Tax=Quillaja saponaria TaxID=32244 RepID=A0AAD7PYJ1_QUISA|nr:DNA-directed RNA polymerase subunit [Quillaja saponaria]